MRQNSPGEMREYRDSWKASQDRITKINRRMPRALKKRSEGEHVKILVIGATGPTGRELVSQGLEQGLEMTAAVRQPESAALPEGVALARADVMDAASLAAAVARQGAVICSLGSKISRHPTNLFSQGTRNLIAGMQLAGVRRLVCITGVGAGDSRGHGGFLYDNLIQPLLLHEIYKDKDRQEEIVRTSGLDWTLVRPGMLTNGPKTGKYRQLMDLVGERVGKISRADVAAYILGAVGDTRCFGKTVNLTY